MPKADIRGGYKHSKYTINVYFSTLGANDVIKTRIHAYVKTISKVSVQVGLTGNIIVRRILADPDRVHLLDAYASNPETFFDHLIRYGFAASRKHVYKPSDIFGPARARLDEFMRDAYTEILPINYVYPSQKECGSFGETVREKTITAVKNNLTIHFFATVKKWAKQFLGVHAAVFRLKGRIIYGKFIAYINEMLRRVTDTSAEPNTDKFDEYVMSSMLQKWGEIDPTNATGKAIRFERVEFDNGTTKMLLQHIKDQYHHLWIPLYGILKYQLDENKKALSLFPHFHTRPTHITVGRKQLITTFNSTVDTKKEKISINKFYGYDTKPKPSSGEIYNEKLEAWRVELLRIQRIEWVKIFPGLERFWGDRKAGDHVFDQTITTNGVKIGLLMNRLSVHVPKKEKMGCSVPKQMKTSPFVKKLNLDQYDTVVGGDPGKVAFVALAKFDRDPTRIQSNHLGPRPDLKSCDSKLWQWETLSYRRFCNGRVERQRRADSNMPLFDKQIQPFSSHVINGYGSYARCVVSQFEERYEFFSNLRYVKQGMIHFSHVQKKVDELVKWTVNFKKNSFGETLVAMGATALQLIQRAKGHIGGPGTRFQKALVNVASQTRDRWKVDFRLTGEPYTSQICRHCNHRHMVSRSPHRYTICPRCHIRGDRDENAAVNILEKGMFEIENHGIPPNCFRRIYHEALASQTPLDSTSRGLQLTNFLTHLRRGLVAVRGLL